MDVATEEGPFEDEMTCVLCRVIHSQESFSTLRYKRTQNSKHRVAAATCSQDM